MPWGEGVLARFLHDVSEAVYASLFTVGHEEVVKGGKALLDTDGEVGRALFSASRGTADLSAVMKKLDNRAGELFKKGGAKPLLNAAIREFKDVSAEAKRTLVNAVAGRRPRGRADRGPRRSRSSGG